MEGNNVIWGLHFISFQSGKYSHLKRNIDILYDIGMLSDLKTGVYMNCRPGCGACCIAVSISSPLPGMPEGKPAGVRCIHLSEKGYCLIHDRQEYPQVCHNLSPSREMCGDSFEEAMRYLSELEAKTTPDG